MSRETSVVLQLAVKHMAPDSTMISNKHDTTHNCITTGMMIIELLSISHPAAEELFSRAIYSTLAKYMLSYAMFYLAPGSTFSNKLNISFRLSHKGVEALSHIYKTESMNMTRRRSKGTAAVRRSQRLRLPLAAGLPCDLDFAGAFFFGRSESSESSPFP